MKKIVIFLFIIVVLYIPNVYAHEKLDDGWHIVVKNDGNQSGKTWAQQEKEWAYYENGKEVLRYSKLIRSHRGWGTAPENSLASFRATKDNGYYAFETDVRFTKDGVGVLSHDAKINNVARNNDLSSISGDVLVADKTLSELRNNYIFNIERVNHDGATVLNGFNTNRITTFEEMLDYVKQSKMHVSIELKDGTKEQIESLVRMAQQKNMHNYVRWISFRTDMLKIVKDYDDDEWLGVNKYDTCDSTHNFYCGEETEYYINKLQTDKNYVFIDTNPMNLPTSPTTNLPSTINSNVQSQFSSSPIPQGVVSLGDDSIEINIGNGGSISYEYNGDGTVKCKSSDSSKLTCSVDTTGKYIEIDSANDSAFNGTVTVYATQGISYSASNDVKFNVKVDTDVNLALSHLKNIEVEGFNINFNKSTNNYVLTLKDEKELNINVSLDSDSYKYSIEGNNDLKNGSKVLIHIQDIDGKTLLTYTIEVQRENPKTSTIVNIPDTFMGVSSFTVILAFIFLIIGFGFIGYGTLVKKQ